MKSTRRAFFPYGWMVLFYFVTFGWIFLHELSRDNNSTNKKSLNHTKDQQRDSIYQNKHARRAGSLPIIIVV